MIVEADLLNLVERLRGKTILVAGDVMLDEYVAGETKRISPEAPVPVVDFRSRWHASGGAANVAANVAALGCHATIVGVVGADDEARHLRAAMDACGVLTEFLVADAKRPTSVKLRILAQNQQIVRLDREVRTPIPSALETALLQRIETALMTADVCILSDYGKGVVTARLAQQTIAACRRADIPVLIDPKSLDLHHCQGATIVKPNKHEAERLAAREIHDDVSYVEVGSHLASLLNGTGILITRGGLGMSLFRHERETFHVAPTARKVYDVTGAGDTVIGVLGAALAAGATLEESVWLASAAAAIVVGKPGTATVSTAELQHYADRCNNLPPVDPRDIRR